ncbi:hypothetical protein [Corynebacterium aurimucosum]
MTLVGVFNDLVWKALWLIPVIALLRTAQRLLISHNPFLSYMEEKAGAKLINTLYWLAILTLLGVVFM